MKPPQHLLDQHPQALRDQPEVDLAAALSGLPVRRDPAYRGPHTHDHGRPVRLYGKAFRWEDPGTGQLRLVADPEGQAKIDRAVAAATRIWSPR